MPYGAIASARYEKADKKNKMLLIAIIAIIVILILSKKIELLSQYSSNNPDYITFIINQYYIHN
jgi:hypothetical protein